MWKTVFYFASIMPSACLYRNSGLELEKGDVQICKSLYTKFRKQTISKNDGVDAPLETLRVASALLLVGEGEHLQEKLAVGGGSNVKKNNKQTNKRKNWLDHWGLLERGKEGTKVNEHVGKEPCW